MWVSTFMAIMNNGVMNILYTFLYRRMFSLILGIF